MLFCFSPWARKLVCLHETDFTNAILVNELRDWQFFFFQMIYNYSSKKLEEVDSKHRHRLKEADSERLGNYLGLTKKEIANLKTNEAVYQIALSEEDRKRVFGILKTVGNQQVFEILLPDPNHLFYYNPHKSQYPTGNEVICLLSKENCSQVFSCQPSFPKVKRRERKKR